MFQRHLVAFLILHAFHGACSTSLPLGEVVTKSALKAQLESLFVPVIRSFPHLSDIDFQFTLDLFEDAISSVGDEAVQNAALYAISSLEEPASTWDQTIALISSRIPDEEIRFTLTHSVFQRARENLISNLSDVEHQLREGPWDLNYASIWLIKRIDVFLISIEHRFGSAQPRAILAVTEALARIIPAVMSRREPEIYAIASAFFSDPVNLDNYDDEWNVWISLVDHRLLIYGVPILQSGVFGIIEPHSRQDSISQLLFACSRNLCLFQRIWIIAQGLSEEDLSRVAHLASDILTRMELLTVEAGLPMVDFYWPANLLNNIDRVDEIQILCDFTQSILDSELETQKALNRARTFGRLGMAEPSMESILVSYRFEFVHYHRNVALRDFPLSDWDRVDDFIAALALDDGTFPAWTAEHAGSISRHFIRGEMRSLQEGLEMFGFGFSPIHAFGPMNSLDTVELSFALNRARFVADKDVIELIENALIPALPRLSPHHISGVVGSVKRELVHGSFRGSGLMRLGFDLGRIAGIKLFENEELAAEAFDPPTRVDRVKQYRVILSHLMHLHVRPCDGLLQSIHGWDDETLHRAVRGMKILTAASKEYEAHQEFALTEFPGVYFVITWGLSIESVLDRIDPYVTPESLRRSLRRKIPDKVLEYVCSPLTLLSGLTQNINSLYRSRTFSRATQKLYRLTSAVAVDTQIVSSITHLAERLYLAFFGVSEAPAGSIFREKVAQIEPVLQEIQGLFQAVVEVRNIDPIGHARVLQNISGLIGTLKNPPHNQNFEQVSRFLGSVRLNLSKL